MKTRRVILFLLSFLLLGATALWVLNVYPKNIRNEGVPQITEPVTESGTENRPAPVTEPATETTTEPVTEEDTEESEDAGAAPARLRIAAVGDIMFHMPQIEYARTESGYDFSESFELIAPYLQRADFTVGNFETTANPESEWSSYPQFNTPPPSLDALLAVGFDALSTANNHCLDTYQSGLISTRREIQSRGMIAFGTREEAGERVEMTEVNGIRMALLSYTYGFNGLEYVLTDEEYTAMVNPLDWEDIRDDIQDAKARGAELVIIYPHWGVEYSRHESREQIDLAHNMIEWGADLVLGSHPHVVQGQEWVDRTDGTRAYIIYSMGNFISGQRLEHNEDIHVEQSVLLDIQVSRTADGKINVDTVDTLPLWVDRTDSGLYRVVATRDGLGDLSHLFEDWKLDRIQSAQEDTLAILATGDDE